MAPPYRQATFSRLVSEWTARQRTPSFTAPELLVGHRLGGAMEVQTGQPDRREHRVGVHVT
jgi:hypothetical protein